jgi:CRP-like cAMP-binding protein
MIEKLAEITSEKEFSKGELIFGPYDTEEKIFVVREGEVEIYQLSPEGKKVIIDILVPGNIFGNSSFSSKPFVEVNDFAVARSRVILCIFRKSDFMNVLRTMPQVAMSLIEEISAKLNETDSRIRDLALSNATTRLIGELMRFAKKVGKEVDDKIVVGTKLTHEELAGMTGVTRETVTRVLKKLRQEKIVDLDKSRHIVIDKNKVREVLNI